MRAEQRSSGPVLGRAPFIEARLPSTRATPWSEKRKERAAHLRVVPELPTAANQRWCMDFVYERIDDGHYFRTLHVVDVFTRECLAIHAGCKLSDVVVSKASCIRAHPENAKPAASDDRPPGFRYAARVAVR